MLRGSRAAVLAVVLLWVLAGPLAMTFGACAAMGGMCDTPCGMTACAVISEAPVLTPGPIAFFDMPALPTFASATVRPSELPPRPLSHSA